MERKRGFLLHDTSQQSKLQRNKSAQDERLRKQVAGIVWSKRVAPQRMSQKRERILKTGALISMLRLRVHGSASQGSIVLTTAVKLCRNWLDRASL